MKKIRFEQIMLLCLRNNAFLQMIQKALVFDEDDGESFHSTYNLILDDLIKDNLLIYEIAKNLSLEESKQNREEPEV